MLLKVARLYHVGGQFDHYISMLEGDFDAQCEALTLDMFCNHAFVSAVYLDGFQADASKMQVLGNAFAAYDTAGLTEHYRKICFDKAARLIHVLIGDNYLRVGKEPGQKGPSYGHNSTHAGGLPVPGLLACTSNWSARHQ